ncbi:MAG: hypothetical protein K6G22_09740 [Lachnospiraceae bacterium]|nr:hypothetical protein [Lachnospiraceae bacterium]
MKLRFYLRGLGIGIVVTALLMGFTLGTSKAGISDEEVKKRAEELGMVEESRLLIKENGTDDTDVTATEDAGQTKPEKEEVKNTADSEKTDEEISDKTSEASDETDETDVTDETGSSDQDKPELKDNSNMELTVSGTVSGQDETDKDSADNEVSTSDAEKKDQADEEVKDEPEASDNEKADVKPSEGNVSVTVSGGDDSYDVCKKLQNLGLIDNASDFDRYLMSRKLDSKLATGTFTIPKPSDYEEITAILTGAR